MGTLAEFQSLVGPSETKVPEVSWDSLEKLLGIAFPPDYRDWASMYPSLEIDGFLWVRHPSEFYGRVGRKGIIDEFGGLESAEPFDQERNFDSDGEVKDREQGRAFFPVKGGLLPWGSTDNGDILMWRCEGSPEQWSVVVVDGQGVFWQDFDCGFLDFLVRLLKKDIRSKVLPQDFPDEPAIRVHRGYETGWNGLQVASFHPTSRWVEYFSGLERVLVSSQRVWNRSCVDDFSKRLVLDGLWDLTAPLIPEHARRAHGGGIARVEDRQVFTAIVFVLPTGCAWRHLPPVFGVSHQTAHRRFTEWSEAALWAKLHRAVIDRRGATGDIDWTRAIVDGASRRAKKGDH